jgi:hypothetical protein
VMVGRAVGPALGRRRQEVSRSSDRHATTSISVWALRLRLIGVPPEQTTA